MYKAKLQEDLFNKLPETGKFVIFGACSAGEKVLNDIKVYKPDSEVIGFIDNAVKGSFCGLPVYRLKEFIDSVRHCCDMVVMATRKDFSTINTIFDLYKVPYIIQTPFLFDYYREKLNILNEQNLKKVLNIFDLEEDKNLYDFMFKMHANLIDTKLADDYFREKYVTKNQGNFTIENHYLEKINKAVIKVAFDLGLNSGLNVIAYDKLLPNLQKTYGFEVIYDKAKVLYIEDFIIGEKLCIVPFALGDTERIVDFYFNKVFSTCSYCDFYQNNPPTDMTNWEKTKIHITTMDKFCRDEKLIPDFIKMDIEGSEMAALLGGIKTIQEYRPQLAISIYHSNEDFVNIPLYLKENLKDYCFRLGHYSPWRAETVLYAIPEELA